MKSHTDYINVVTRCLISFQYIEEALKSVLVRLECLTYFRLKKYTPYNLKPKFDSIQNAAMGRLIEMLTVYSDDQNLITELKKIKKRRDKVVHQSFLMTTKERTDEKIIHLKASELEDVEKSSEAIYKKLLEKSEHLDSLLNKITAEQSAEVDRP